MKTILLMTLLILSASTSYACSCLNEFSTPSAEAIAAKTVENLGLQVGSMDIVKYVPTVKDRLTKLDAEGNCSGKLAGQPVHFCTERFNGNIKVSIKKKNCFVLLKVLRLKDTFNSKVLENTCIE